MDKSFENTVSRVRKCAEMIDELKEYVNILTAERDRLEGEIISELVVEVVHNLFLFLSVHIHNILKIHEKTKLLSE